MIQMPFVKRLVLGVLAVAVVVLLAGPTVAGAGPVRVKLDILPGTLSGLCTFDVAVTVPVNSEYNIVFFDGAGNPVKAITEGRLVVTFTNLSNGHTLTLNISGPGIATVNPDGSQTIVFLGNGVLFVSNSIVVSSGRVVLVAPDPLSPGIIVSASGNQRNLCQLLG
jgi:hypothetical protein